MRGLGVFVVCVIHFGVFCCGATSYPMLSFSFLTSRWSSRRHHHHSLHPLYEVNPPTSSALPPSESHGSGHKVPLAPMPAPAHPPNSHGYAPRHSLKWHHHHQNRQHAHSPSTDGPDCSELFCSDPMTATPIGSPCGCILPLKIELDLGVAPFLVLTVVPELEVEVADGTYVKQSQVRIMSAVASGPEKTRVDIDLVPLGEKFDNMTAFLIYERFWEKKVPINATVFGDYEVIFVQYPGIPSSPPFLHRAAPPGVHGLPLIAYIPPKKFQKMNARTIAIIVSSSFVFVLLCIGLFFILSKWRKLKNSSTSICPVFTPPPTKPSAMKFMMSSSLASSVSSSLAFNMPTCPPSVKTFTLAELDLATEKFSSKKIIGEGGFGRVYLGILGDGTEVAVKLLTREDQNGDREFIAEVEMLSHLHHRNLIKLIGICIEENTRCLVYELVHNGSVDSHLHGVDKERCFLDWDARMKIALGAARGLAYLHEDSNPRVIHRDFKASNVLLKEDFTPKVSDFGLAREASDGSHHHISSRFMGTFGYVAPEYAMTGHLLVKSDVYSYGVVLLELLSGRKPVDMSQPQGQENLVSWARPLLMTREGLQQLVDPSLSRNDHFDDMAKVAAIASMCVHPEVSQRPFMGEVVQALKLIYNDTNEACEDSTSQRDESYTIDGDFRCEMGGTGGGGSSWWNTSTSRLTFGYASSFVTIDGNVMDHRPHSTSSLVGRVVAELPTRLNRSGPLRTKRHRNSAFSRLQGSMSERELLSRRFAIDGNWA